MIMHVHAKFTSLDFINEKILEKCRFFTQTGDYPLSVHLQYMVYGGSHQGQIQPKIWPVLQVSLNNFDCREVVRKIV